MANIFLHNWGNTCKAILCLLFLTPTLFIANSARILDEVESQPQAIGILPAPGAVNPSLTTGPVTTTLPPGQTPATTTTSQVGYETHQILSILLDTLSIHICKVSMPLKMLRKSNTIRYETMIYNFHFIFSNVLEVCYKFGFAKL